ncbi:hypothetical protein ACFVKB_47135 [Rhodococcus sp. NPDC127530]|uniref:hypothetical protein n=1 Tax=unclassified Rhodococcus (in: high G+C Gram-positive bacteria) TaxID=192944 RepID=UPI003628BAD5
MTALVEAVLVRDPDGPTHVWVFIDGAPVEAVESCVDAGAGWDWEDWCEHRDELLTGASAAARELLFEVLDGPPGGVYVEGREDRPWLDPEP